MFKYNLQFFAEEDEINDDTMNPPEDNPDEGVDAKAFADIISEKDNKIEELELEIKKLHKTNANLLLKISSDNQTKELSIEEQIEQFMHPRKE